MPRANSLCCAVIVGIAVATATSLSAQTNGTAAQAAPRAPAALNFDSLPANIPGIPTRPDAVTVVPFQLVKGLILFPGEVDGRRGTFMLDTGAQVVCVNDAYLQPHFTDGVIDTVPGAGAFGGGPRTFNLHSVRVGTITHVFDASDAGRFPANAATMRNQRILNFGGLPPVLGLWGVTALRSVETIIDYPRRRLIFIALDSLGHRLVDVPAYKPTTTLPMILDYRTGLYKIVADLSGKVDTVLIDTGNPDNTLTPGTQQALADHLSPRTGTGYSTGRLMTLDTMRLAGKSYHPFPVAILNAGGYGMNIFGYPFLNQFGVVGFNLRAKQFSTYGS